MWAISIPSVNYRYSRLELLLQVWSRVDAENIGMVLTSFPVPHKDTEIQHQDNHYCVCKIETARPTTNLSWKPTTPNSMNLFWSSYCCALYIFAHKYIGVRSGVCCPTTPTCILLSVYKSSWPIAVQLLLNIHTLRQICLLQFTFGPWLKSIMKNTFY